jgi:hypothetical protein
MVHSKVSTSSSWSEFFLADDIASRLKRLGAEIIGPAGGIADATSLLLCSERIDFAVLDLNLQGELAYSVAALLLDRGVPFILTTGYDKSSIPEDFRDVPYWNKPYNVDEMLAILSSLARSLR